MQLRLGRAATRSRLCTACTFHGTPGIWPGANRAAPHAYLVINPDGLTDGALVIMMSWARGAPPFQGSSFREVSSQLLVV